MSVERLQKVLAASGVASRRASEILIQRGLVTVNGVVVTELGSRVDPEVDRITVNGVAVQTDVSKRYVMLNKPTGVVSSMFDDKGRPDLREFAERYDERLFNVGRLDYETSGLLILTNDGEAAHVLAHPSFEVSKTYLATVEGDIAPGTLRTMRDGIELDDGFIRADSVHAVGNSSRGRSIIEITLHSGRNRIVRRFCEAVGHPVIALHRKSFGPLHIGGLKAGQSRELTNLEVRSIIDLARRNDVQEDPRD
ncbi:ribosomal large subunit pseudouridine synthase B [Microbacteriaceae bacterium MWH-Ta3]|nr:ribosomal large subunit pseudouridine synthase B [Microbacteriaceae bacterium MWH-Ta3]